MQWIDDARKEMKKPNQTVTDLRKKKRIIRENDFDPQPFMCIICGSRIRHIHRHTARG
jgi:hypothetical protein